MPDNLQNEKSPSSVLKEYSVKIVRNENFALVGILIALIAVFGVMTRGLTLRWANVLNILLQSSMRGVTSVGQALVLLTAGIDVSVGGMATLVACIGGALMTTMPGYLGPVPVGVSLVLMLLAGAGLGAINGLFVSRLRLAPLIVTLAMWQIGIGAAFQVTKGGETVHYLPESLAFFGKGNIGGVPVPIIIFAAVIVVGYLVLNHTTFSRSIYAVGGSEVSAWLSGIKVKNIRFWVYAISGLCAGIAGLIHLSRIMAANIMALYALELDSIAAVVIGGVSLFGGKGSIIGVLLGVLILGVVSNGMNLLGLTIYMQWIVKGVIILMAVVIDALRRR